MSSREERKVEVIIEIEGEVDIEELEKEIERILGEKVTVEEINKGTFTVSVESMEKAKELVNTINICHNI